MEALTGMELPRDAALYLVVYGGDSTHNGATSACGTEQFTLSITNS